MQKKLKRNLSYGSSVGGSYALLSLLPGNPPPGPGNTKKRQE